jgi:superfamily II DNA or RNA helicase
MAEAQKGLYGEHQHTLVRLLQKKYLTEIDRRRILACVTNLRMACGSTYLLDRTTNVSPKLEELQELLTELLGHGQASKVVVFSQWEVMLQLAAEVVEKQGIGHGVLHGNVPGAERRKLLERFRDEESCRVFLSTDAGGTGLNLQSADTVINLEVPWNPAVLEQRIARVHRMGQHRPVQVFNLVMRDSIEERVLKVLVQKQSVFQELFAGTSDEIALDSMGQQAFLEAMRELFQPAPQPAVVPVEPAPTVPREASVEAGQELLQAGVQFLEALATAFTRPGSRVTTDPETGQPALLVPLPQAQLVARGTQALQTILQALGGAETNGPGGPG